MRLALVVGIVLAVRIAHAEPPTFAVDIRAKEGLADKIAPALEEAFRKVGSAKSAEYRSKGTKKDRIAASTDACPNPRTAGCAQVIGGTLGVDYIFAGLVETKNKKYVLEIDMISVRTGKRVRSFKDFAPTTTTAKKWALSVYTRLVDTATGSLDISCNAPRATVFLDGHNVTELYQGRTSLSDLALGTHALELRAAGYQPYASDVEVDGPTAVNVLLQPAP